jgi:Bifunctional DNA primase/polymerase, N-terminal
VTAEAAAVEAARRGWAVFPCRPGDKRPAVADWEHRACADPGRVGRYWPSDQHNIGIACGPSRLVVVDLDTHVPLPDDWRLPGVHDGRDVLALLAEWAGQTWPTTYTVKTPTGGLHLYYTAPDGPEIRNSAGRIGPAVDVRGCGGYVLAAGSVLDERAYPGNPGCRELVTGGRPYEMADDRCPESLPAWLAVLAADGEPSVRPAGRPGQHAAPGARLQGLIDTVRRGQEGDRNGPLYWAARRAAEMITAGQVDRSTAEESLVAAALEAGLRGGEREARRTFASAMRGGGL